jgi:hypothetical protein
MRMLVRFAAVVPLLVGGCGDTTPCADAGIPDLTMHPEDLAGTGKCGPNETLTNGVCVANPVDGGGLTCGPNTMPMGNSCVVASSACLAMGTVLDPATSTCVKATMGTPVNNGSHNFIHGYSSVYAQQTGDAGVVCVPLGTANMLLLNNLPGTTQLYNKACVPLGGRSIMLHYPVGANAPMFTAFGSTCKYDMPSNTVNCMVDPTAEVTLDDWQKNCTGTAAWRKGPFNGKNVYQLVVDVQGCIPNSLYTVWTFTSPTGTRAGAVTSAPVGGLPNTMQTDTMGNGHFETFEDPSVWFIPGALIPYSGAHNAPATVATGAMASALTIVFYHSNVQTNANPQACELKDNTMPPDPTLNPCLTPQPGIVNVGRSGTDAHTQLLDEPGTLLSDLPVY